MKEKIHFYSNDSGIETETETKKEGMEEEEEEWRKKKSVMKRCAKTSSMTPNLDKIRMLIDHFAEIHHFVFYSFFFVRS